MCRINKKYTTGEFIAKAKTVHGEFYDYSLVNYVNSKTKVVIICSLHKKFEQLPANHLRGYGCAKCYGFNRTTDDFIRDANIIHKNKYDYSQTKYISNKKNITIICPTHGIFIQRASNHLLGQGCSRCAMKHSPTTKEFIENAIKIHGSKYDYSMVEYVNNRKKVKIICPNHGMFEQAPTSHLHGYGCILCCESKGEKAIRMYLDANNIMYEKEKRFGGCRNKTMLPFDFYLSKNNLLIEFDGKQHQVSNDFFGGETGLVSRKINDRIKNKFAKKQNILLIRIKYDEIKNINKILEEVI